MSEAVQTDVTVDEHDEDAWVREYLMPRQLVAAKEERYPRRHLGTGTQILMWALRLYVLLMLVVVTMKFVTAVHSGGTGS